MYLVFITAVALFSTSVLIYKSTSETSSTSLDCMSLAKSYLGYVRENYSDREDFDSVIWPRAIDVETHMHNVCVDSIEKNGLIDGKSIQTYLTTSKQPE